MAFSIRFGIMISCIILVISALASAAAIPDFNITDVNVLQSRTIPVTCAWADPKVPYETATSYIGPLCSALAGEMATIAPGKTIRHSDLFGQPATPIFFSATLGNTCTSDVHFFEEGCRIELQAIADQCSDHGGFGSGWTWFGCLGISYWITTSI